MNLANVRPMASPGNRLRSHVAVPLYRNAYALMLSGVGSGVLGMVFWAVASRAYPPHIVGTSTAAISALIFLTGVAGLYLDGALYRFLPRAGDATGRLIGWTSLVAVLSAVVASAIFLLGIDLWAPALTFADSSPWIVLACIGAPVLACLLVLQDGALVGLRRAEWVPVKNIPYSVAKILALVAVVGVAPRYGILLAWVVPSVLFVAFGYLLVLRLTPRHREMSRAAQDYVGVGWIARYAAGNYVGMLCMQAYRNLPPLLVIHQAGATASAFFYPPWLIASSLILLTSNVSTSLVVEGAFARDQLAIHTRRALRQTARLLLPIAAVLFFGAPLVLRIFGADYADEGAGLLRLLAVSLIPASICVLSFGVARIQDHVGSIIANQVLLAVLTLGLSSLLIPPLGLAGVGVSSLAAQTLVGFILFWTELRPALRMRSPLTEEISEHERLLGLTHGREERA
jgi:O-antigen/teichoic acid export membrane protein